MQVRRHYHQQFRIVKNSDVVGNHLMLIYKKDLISSPPQNTDELIDIGKKMTVDIDGDGKIGPMAMVSQT